MDSKNSADDAAASATLHTATASVEVGSLTVMMRSYFSPHHLWAARYFTEQAKRCEVAQSGSERFDIRHRAYVTNSVLSAVAFLEAAINELYQDASDHGQDAVSPLDSDLRRVLSVYWDYAERPSLLNKYQLALALTGHPMFDKGAMPYQDAALVVQLRNELVHSKPQTLGGEVQHKLVQKLSGKFAPNSLIQAAGNPWFPDKCLGHGCAKWAIDSAVKFADAFFDRIGVEARYQKVQFAPEQGLP